ncbi:MAG: aldehyde ferredoxin oxidoreductase N-terminal domain-containing protein [Promethearchaeota archaeon]
MKEKFVGGRGFNFWLIWNALPKNKIVQWNDPENEIYIGNGPLGARTFYLGSGKSIMITISPLTGLIINSNVGRYFGSHLKFSGFDALEIQGKSNKEIIIFINREENSISIEEALSTLPKYSHLLTQKLTEKYAKGSSEIAKQHVSIVSIDPAAKHSKWGMLNFSWYNRKRK